ncbi:MAG: NADH-quinone oxidoreductase subunit J [Planctomycetaceae bacterium]
MDEIADWAAHNLSLLIPLVTGAAAVWLLLPRVPERRSFRVAGAVLGMIALVCIAFWWTRPSGEIVHDVLFFLLSAIAISSAVLMITSHNPVYAALWFAMATLSVCGLFLLRSAPFLAAATVIVYAGAIIVTFLFVIMLAQQQGLAIYDRQASQPLSAVVATFLLLGGILVTIPSWRADADRSQASVRDTAAEEPARTIGANPLSQPVDGDLGTMRGLGRSLFGDYLFAVELAGTLLLIACIGAIAISPRRSQGSL